MLHSIMIICNLAWYYQFHKCKYMHSWWSHSQSSSKSPSKSNRKKGISRCSALWRRNWAAVGSTTEHVSQTKLFLGTPLSWLWLWLWRLREKAVVKQEPHSSHVNSRGTRGALLGWTMWHLMCDLRYVDRLNRLSQRLHLERRHLVVKHLYGLQYPPPICLGKACCSFVCSITAAISLCTIFMHIQWWECQ